MGATADGNGATYLRRERDEPPSGAKEAACGRICGEKRGVFLARSFCPHKDDTRKTAVLFFQRGEVDRAKEEAAFQDEEMTEPTSSRNIPNQLQYYQKTAADPRQFFSFKK